jgi:predicted dehydrogenase
VVGLGSIGRRHLDNLLECEVGPVAVVSASANLGSLPAGVMLYRDLAEAIDTFRPDFAVIANASPAHVPTAQILAEAGAHLFIEKPLADRMEGLAALIETCACNNLVTLVGYTLRFLPVMLRTRELLPTIGTVHFLSAEVGQYLPDWRPGQDYRNAVSAQRKLGGGALLELSHEIDYVRWFLGEPDDVFAMLSQSGALEIDTEDSADLLLAYPHARARIHLDFLERGKHRRCRVTGSKGTLETDLIAGTISILRAGFSKTVVETPIPNDPYKASLEHFLACVAFGTPTRIPLADGAATLSLIEAARSSAQAGAVATLVLGNAEVQITS